jgi:hypothetical protein
MKKVFKKNYLKLSFKEKNLIKYSKLLFNWKDPLSFETLLSEEEIQVRDSVFILLT